VRLAITLGLVNDWLVELGDYRGAFQMTPVRALFAGLVAAILFGAALFIATSFAGGRPHDLVPLLSLTRAPSSLLCFLAAWGAFALGGLGVIAAFLAFLAPDDDDDPRLRRRGFPKAAPLALIAAALGAAFIALRCAAGAAAAPIAVAVLAPVEAAVAVDRAEAELLGGEPIANAATPEAVAGAAAFQWRFKDPLLRGDGPLWMGGGQPFSDEAEAARLLCGKAWIAVTGSASEEGPPDRNAARSEIRTRQAMTRAAQWLARHAECGAPILFGVDLGQHTPTMSSADEGAATAYQRQILVASRARADGEAALSVAAAEAELAVFLSDPAMRAALLAGRQLIAAPAIIRP
jgi:hypothetical protein